MQGWPLYRSFTRIVRLQIIRHFERLEKSRFASAVQFHTIAASPGGEIGRRKGLNRLSSQYGNDWCEWSQIRGNLSAVGRWQSRAKSGTRSFRVFGKV